MILFFFFLFSCAVVIPASIIWKLSVHGRPNSFPNPHCFSPSFFLFFLLFSSFFALSLSCFVLLHL